MLPAVGEVILVQEALPQAEAELAQMHPPCVVKGGVPKARDRELASVDAEAVQVSVSPPQSQLQVRA